MGNSYFNTSLELSKEDEDQHSFQVEKNNDSFGERFEIPKAYGHGVLERYAIRPDLILSIVQHETLKEA
ncbi:MAG: hypothetical protein OEZ36_09405, partial [Spirochaetota bacterium]|nr:hypothetical protein [Spirochaetota bacterium]